MITSTKYTLFYTPKDDFEITQTKSFKKLFMKCLPVTVRKTLARKKLHEIDELIKKNNLSNTLYCDNQSRLKKVVCKKNQKRIRVLFKIIGNIVGTVSILLIFSVSFFAGIL